MLNELLRQGGYLSYTGIDISQAAVGSANARLADERTRFIAVDANVFESNERFDIVVFNETLYYFADPGATLRHFGRMLNADGVFVVSMALGSGLRDQMLKLRIWWDVASTHEVLDELTLYGAKRPMRIIKVLRPLRATGTGESD